jgi:MFS family permease
MLIKATNQANRGKSYGYFYAFFSLGTVTGSALLGWLSITLTQKFALTGGILLVAGLIFVVMQQTKKRDVPVR